MRFLKFAVVGVANTAITFLVFNLATRLLGMPAAGANAVGWIAGFANSFVWNSAWTFADRPGLARRRVLLRFAVCNLLALGVSTAVVVGLQAAAAGGGVAAALPRAAELNLIELAAIAGSLSVNYIVSSRWAFRVAA
jgi:putative flippase GtrA